MMHKDEHEHPPAADEHPVALEIVDELDSPAESSLGRVLNSAFGENGKPSPSGSRTSSPTRRRAEQYSPSASPKRNRKTDEESVTTGISGLTVPSLRPEVAVTQSMIKLSEKYDISEKLGKGGFGEVSLATCTATGEKLAAKLVRADDSDKFGMFKNEFEIAKRLQHPNIVKVHDMLINDQLCYLVMDLCTGGDLVQFVQSHEEWIMKTRVYTPPEGHVLAKLLWQMLQSVRYLHHHNIVHRDIKMENFLLNSSSCGVLKLIDFGFAKILEKGQVLKDVCGTPGYIAPEVLERAGYGLSCDGWSLGVCAYLLFTSEFPIPSQKDWSNEELLKQTKEHEIVYKSSALTTIPAEGKTVLKMLLQKDPSNRASPKQILSTDRWLRTAGRGKNDCCCTIA
mmetsp:Transcript_29684/g.47820  ORF Transcript_29684/g.47820 Transcript_29684/m.47820 type:complete len:396 (+) Transcript_29684:59-1246(+)|eukprot:CAMPEP_0169070014 /NCGR_PEP_ID=MMETSP1015-20121227/4883_1 /TAXON_ID=342587 /ORGANISM="Karlodinium micrum, Strain CCMP2283" /LENGTH=395 /DNA_ID=CAMNT_0009128971 /DNA_START=58 /DNA_END=1245 /DNA_ORIENTATION=+